MRLIDFASFPEFGIKLSTSSVARDGHELNNLSRTSSQENVGFLCERFVKPPVEIIVEFRHPISLTCIVVNPKLGIHTLQAIALSVSSAVDEPGLVNQHTFCGKLEYQDNKPKYIGCYSPDFQLDQVYDTIVKTGSKCATKKDLIPFSKGLHGLHHIKSLKITILRVQKSGIPGIRYLEIWGQPSRRCALTLQSSIWDSWEERQKKMQQDLQNDDDIPEFNDPFLTHGGLSLLNSSQNYRTNARKKPRLDSCKTDSVPSEYLDAITFEIMGDPVTLPSGNVCDRRTIVRHLETQANDPFTRLPMSSKDLVSNILLKNQISKWLDSAAEETTPLPNQSASTTADSNRASENPSPTASNC